jgi:ABC-type polysaccharide/polyol phosphate transport system ATPase subunit
MPESTVKARRAASTEPLVRLKSVGLRYRFPPDGESTLKGLFLDSLLRRRAQPVDFWALRDVTLEFRRGEVVGIVGPNGSGKSSLLKVIAGVLEPTEGTVDTSGQMPPIIDAGSIVNPMLSGRQNARIYGALFRIPPSEIEGFLSRIEQFSELGAFFDAPVRIYSSGMVARLVFSIAVTFAPDILLVDEILSVGDEHFQKKSYFKMLKLIERGSLAVIVSHNTSFLEGLCDQVVLLHQGRVVSRGKPAEVLRYYRSHFS